MELNSISFSLNVLTWLCRTLRNYLTWHLITDRVSSLSHRFKDARAQYKKVSDSRWHIYTYKLFKILTVYSKIKQFIKLNAMECDAIKFPNKGTENE